MNISAATCSVRSLSMTAKVQQDAYTQLCAALNPPQS